MKYSVIVVAAGDSSRFYCDVNKLLYPLRDGRTVIEHALDVFREDLDCSEIIVVTNHDVMKYLTQRYTSCGKIIYCYGGSSRQESVLHGLMAVKEEIVLVHDGARCYLEKSDLNGLKEAVEEGCGAILCKSVTDTVKTVQDDIVEATLDRRTIRLAQTPQAFPTEILTSCYKKAQEEGFTATDDAQLIERYSDLPIKCVETQGSNTKITFIEDIERGM